MDTTTQLERDRLRGEAMVLPDTAEVTLTAGFVMRLLADHDRLDRENQHMRDEVARLWVGGDPNQLREILQ